MSTRCILALVIHMHPTVMSLKTRLPVLVLSFHANSSGFFLFISLKEQNKSNTLFHDANILASALDLLMAGTETTSTTLQWAILLLMKYPEIQSRTPLWFCFSYIGY